MSRDRDLSGPATLAVEGEGHTKNAKPLLR